MKPVAAVLSGLDNDSYMVASCEKRLFDDVPYNVFCPVCGWKTNCTFTRPSFRLGKLKLDVSFTFDHACIISAQARDVLQSCCGEAVTFHSLPQEPHHFHLLPPSVVVSFDTARRGTRFGELCKSCELYDSVAGATPAFLRSFPPEGVHLMRTDVFFGSFNERTPEIVVSALLYERL